MILIFLYDLQLNSWKEGLWLNIQKTGSWEAHQTVHQDGW